MCLCLSLKPFEYYHCFLLIFADDKFISFFCLIDLFAIVFNMLQNSGKCLFLAGKIKNGKHPGQQHSLICCFDFDWDISIEKHSLLIVKSIVRDILHLFRCNYSQILNTILQLFSKQCWFLINSLHLFIQISQHLMHLLFLIILHTFSELIHYEYFIFSLFSNNQR